MRIYCNREINKYDFDYYLGKDIWVGITDDCTYAWVRFLDKTDYCYKVNAMFVDDFNRDYQYSADSFNTAFNRVWDIVLDTDFHIVQPIELRTTEEFIKDEDILQ